VGNLLTTGVAFLASQRALHMASSVTYARPSTGHTVSILATVGRSMGTVDTPAGTMRVVSNERDYLITAADLILNGALTVPQRGDRITDAAGTWEVQPMLGEPCYRFSDPHGVSLRIHTKRV
jgi:hypothetical protein